MRKSRQVSPLRRHAAAVLGVVVALSSLVMPALSKNVSGRLTLQAQQAQVVTKFCFDFNPKCTDAECADDQHPGIFTFRIFDGQPITSPTGNATAAHIALLDDETRSFSEVSRVWDELTCTDILKAAKQSFPVNWDAASGTGRAEIRETNLVQHLRPRWWYIAFVSCSNHTISFSYNVRLLNLLNDWQKEFSVDTIGAYRGTFILCILFGSLTMTHMDSMRSWCALSRTTNWLRLHPALLVLAASSWLGTLGECFWMAYYSQYQQAGEANEFLAVFGRGCIVAARVLVSLLLILFSRGQCVCTPDVAWADHQEIVGGLALFGVLSFVLELWGDSELRSTDVEYVYDTRVGSVLVAFDVFFLWLYASRSWQTFQSETRLKPRFFYRCYSLPLGLWFAALPIVATIASILAPWVRWRITFIVNGAVHVAALSLLIYTFRPENATKVYDMQSVEYKPIKQDSWLEELDHM